MIQKGWKQHDPGLGSCTGRGKCHKEHCWDNQQLWNIDFILSIYLFIYLGCAGS